MEISKEGSERIRAISFVCALMVVGIHCSSIPRGWWSGASDTPVWIVALQTLGTNTIARLAVPWFFVISGFFLVKDLDISSASGFSGCFCGVFAWWKRSLLRRVFTLGIPYLLWNLIYYVFKLSTGKYGFDAWHCAAQLTGYDLYEAPACGQLWYVRCVFFYVLCAPVFVVLFGNRCIGMMSIVTLAVCWLVGVGIPMRYMQLTDFSYIMYFGSGVYLGLGHNFPIKLTRKIGFVLVVITVIFVMGVMYGAISKNGCVYGVASKILVVVGVPTLWGNGQRIARRTQRWKHLYGLTFFVYAMHVILVSVAYKIASRLMSPVMYESVGYLVKIAVGVFGSIAIGKALGRFAPRMLKTLSGGRA